MNPNSSDNALDRESPQNSEAVAETNASRQRSIGRELRRAASLIGGSTIGGLLIGLGLWWLMTSGWSLFEHWLWPSSSGGRGTGGDPIDNWARGVTRMFVMLSFLIPGGLVGSGVGVRLWFSDASTWKGCLAEIRGWRIWSGDARRQIRLGNRWGNISLFAGIGILVTLRAGFQIRAFIPKSAALPIAVLLLILAGYAGAKGVRQRPRVMAICGLVLAVYSLALMVFAVGRTGLEGFLEEWL